MDELSRDELIRLLKERDALNALLQEQIEAQQQLLARQQEQLQTLANDNKLLKRALFGNRRERFDDPLQKTLFDSEWLDSDAPSENASDDQTDSDERSDSASSKKKGGGNRGKIVFPDAMPRKQVVHPLREEDIPEHLRGRDDLRVFRKKVGQYVEFVESSGYVVEEYVEVLAADNEDATETDMVQATRPPRIVNSYAGSSLLASLAVDRFARLSSLLSFRRTARSRRAEDSSQHDLAMDDPAVDGAVTVGRVDADSRESVRSHLRRRDSGKAAEARSGTSGDRLPLDIGWRRATSLQRLLLYRRSQPRGARRVPERLFRSVGFRCLRLLRIVAVRVDRASRLGVLPCARASKVRRSSSLGRDASNHKGTELLSTVVRH